MQRKEQITAARERWRRITKVVAQGTPAKVAAKRFGVSYSLVRRALFAATIKPTRKAKEAATNRANRMEMARMVRDGNDPYEVARLYGVNVRRVYYAVRENKDVA